MPGWTCGHLPAGIAGNCHGEANGVIGMPQSDDVARAGEQRAKVIAVSFASVPLLVKTIGSDCRG